MNYKEQLLDPRWQKKRLKILERDKWTCQWCGAKDKTLNVHHFCYENGLKAWEASDDTLTTLCADCHKVNHLKNLTPMEKDLIELLRLNGQTQNPYSQAVLTVANGVILKYKG